MGSLRDTVANAIKWTLAAFGVIFVYELTSVAAGALIGVYTAFAGISVSDIDIQLLQAAMQVAVFAVAACWWGYLFPRSFAARWQGSCPLRGGTRDVMKRILLVIVIGIALQIVIGYLCDVALQFFPAAAHEYDQLVEESGMDEVGLLPVLTTIIGAPLSEELVVRGVIFEFSLRAFNPQCRSLWKRRRGIRAEDGAIVPAASPSKAGIAAAIVLQALLFGVLHMNIVQGCYAFAAALVIGWVFYITGRIRCTMLLHFAFNGGSYFMGLLWFVDTGLAMAITVAMAFAVLAWALRELDRACRTPEEAG